MVGGNFMARKGRVPKPAAADTKRERAKGVLARVNSEGLRALRILAIERDTTLQALAVEALNDVLAKYGKLRTVRNPLLED
jgi:hypothetical protein